MTLEERVEISEDKAAWYIAKFAHEVNRAYCQAIGDNSQLPWKKGPD